MVSQFCLETAIQRINDWGFKVLGHDIEGITIKPLYGHYDIIETLKDICCASGVKIKSYYLLKDGNIKIVYDYKWKLREEGVI